MKQLSTLLFITGLVFVTKAQNALPDINGFWTIRNSRFDPNATPQLQEWFSYLDIYPSWNSDTLMVMDNNQGSFRSSDNKVWFRSDEPSGSGPFDFGIWYLLYDFNLQPGDTAYMENFGMGQFEPAIIDSIVITNDYLIPLKKFYLSNEDIIIEKIGSVAHPFKPYISNFEIFYRVCSYEGSFQNGDFIYFYPDPNTDAWCNSPLSTAEILTKTVEIFPNPVNTHLAVLSTGEKWQYEICALSGAVISMGKTEGDNPVIDVSDFPEGCYILKLKNYSGIVVNRKFVVCHF